jgi:hypothetical protein
MNIPKKIHDQINDPTRGSAEKMAILLEYLFSPAEQAPSLDEVMVKVNRILDKVEKYIDTQIAKEDVKIYFGEKKQAGCPPEGTGGKPQ